MNKFNNTYNTIIESAGSKMTVAQFIEWLKSQDQGAYVNVVSMESPGYAAIVPFNPAEHSEYSDLRNNPRVSDTDPRKDVRTLDIGNTDF